MFGVIGLSDNDPLANYGPMVKKTVIAMMTLSGVALTLRFCSRRVARQPIKADDWLIIAGTVLTWAMSLTEYKAVDAGFGRHIYTLTSALTRKFLIFLWIVNIQFIVNVAIIKFSILAFYRRIFNVSATKIPAYIIAGITLSWTIALFFVGIFSCIPVHGFWDRAIGPKCVSTSSFYWAFGTSLITDLMLLAFPIPYIWRLQMAKSQKIALTGTFAVGGFIIIIGCLHVVTVAAVAKTLDVTWYLVPVGLWSVVECNIGVILACLPSMLPLLRLIMGQRQRSTNDSAGTPYSSSVDHNKWSKNKASQNTDMNSFSRLHEIEVANDDHEGHLKTRIVRSIVGGDSVQLGQLKKPGIMVRSDVEWTSHPI